MTQLNEVLQHPEVWPLIAPAGVKPFDVDLPPKVLCHYYEGGVVLYHPYRDGLKVHPAFLPDRRGAHALACIRDSLSRQIGPVYAEIDAELRHVRAFAVLSGFELVARGRRYLYRRKP